MSAQVLGATTQLECLGFETDRAGAVTVHVKRPSQLFGLALEQALRRIDEFKEADRARLLRALFDIYNIPACSAVCPACGHRHAECAPVHDQVSDHPAPRRTRKPKSTVKEST